MSSAQPAVSVEEFTALHESHSQLHTMMTELLTSISSMTSNSIATPAATPQDAASTVQLQVVSAFVPPIPGVGTNSTSTASITLHTQFSDVDAAVITAIITHEFKAVDLHKLDPTNRDKKTTYTFNSSTNQFEVSHRAAKEYRTPFTVLIPLQTYFDILVFHANNATATGAFYRYTAHLLKLIAEYEWTAVYDYHTIFFNRRRAEMAAGDYSQWDAATTTSSPSTCTAIAKPLPQSKEKGAQLAAQPILMRPAASSTTVAAPRPLAHGVARTRAPRAERQSMASINIRIRLGAGQVTIPAPAKAQPQVPSSRLLALAICYLSILRSPYLHHAPIPHRTPTTQSSRAPPFLTYPRHLT